MPIYEFYCPDCHTIFSFLSKTVNTTKRPSCPKCGRTKLSREVSMFAMTGRAGEADDELGDLPIDESKMEQAVNALASDAENINEDDPRAAAQLMRKFSNMTGLEFGESMENALHRMEAGEDPEKIEEEMGDAMEDEEPFLLPGQKAGKAGAAGRPRGAAKRDETLHELQYQYLLGQDVMVAPVYLPGMQTWRVYLPDDEWIHLWSGKTFGKGWCEVSAPIGAPPVFYRRSSQFADLLENLPKA